MMDRASSSTLFPAYTRQTTQGLLSQPTAVVTDRISSTS
jgi:hypothetical protein